MPLHLRGVRVTDAYVVVHTYSPAATALSALVDEARRVHHYNELFGGSVRVAYATYGSEELARTVVHALVERTACSYGETTARTSCRCGPVVRARKERVWSGCATCTCAPRTLETPRPLSRAARRRRREIRQTRLFDEAS